MDFWNVSPELRTLLRPKSVSDLFNGFSQKGQIFIDFLKGWWPLKDHDNVLMMHFTDMKRDHLGTIKKVSEFLGFGLSAAQLSNVARLTSFTYMKEHGEKFELRNTMLGGVTTMKPGGMVRTGLVGTAAQEGLTVEHLREFQSLIDAQLTPTEAKWLIRGGPFGIFEL